MKTLKIVLLAALLALFGAQSAFAQYPIGPDGFDLTATPTTPAHSTCVLYTGKGGFFTYAKAEGAINAGEFVYIDENCDARTVDTTASGSTPKRIGCAAATAADEDYLWLWLGGGEFECIIANAVAADTALTTTATAGDAGTGGDAIAGLRSIDLGVTDTRVTVQATSLMGTND